MIKANTIENLLADQIFKIKKSDENISNYLNDCLNPFNCKESQEIHFRTIRGLESKIN